VTRYEPARAGIINMWDYRDEEFSFAGGWLILRGPNGSGKTKALEVLFPFVLDGRIDPKRLNPFAAEDRTMKSNLLFRGTDNAVGYVWLEFRHRDTGQAVTIGIGLHAQRHRDTPVRWHFVADGRVGEDFSLLTDDDRPMTKKQLAEEIGAGNIYDSPTEYRAAIDQRLFRLGPERYEQFLTLILTLRRPQLAKNLDPVKLSDTLTDGLRPVDDDLIGEAARSFDDMETVARTLEGLVAADEATAAFLASYTTYLRTHARAAADALTRRSETTREQRSAVSQDEEAALAARDGQAEAGVRREQAETSVAVLRGRIEQLRTSGAYQAVEQMGDLERLVRTCLQAADDARSELGRRQAATARARAEAGQAQVALAGITATVTRTAAEVADHATAAGIAWQAADADPASPAERAGARVTVRLADVRAVRAALAEHRKAGQARDLARITLDRATEALTTAEQAEQAESDAVEEASAAARQALAGWSARHAGLLPANGWQDLTQALAAAIARFGEPDAPSLESTFSAATQDAEQAVRDAQAAVRAQRTAVAAQRSAVAAERDAIAAERDDAPPPYPGRGADRVAADGAALWRLVRFTTSTSDERAAAIEAALEATGMLDGWITAENGRAGDDGFLVPGRPVAGASLADVLEPEDETPVARDLITAVLRSVTLDGDPFSGAAVIGADGRYSHRVHRRHRPGPPPRRPDRRVRRPARRAGPPAHRARPAGTRPRGHAERVQRRAQGAAAACGDSGSPA
jgi:hypothetical protein